MIYSVTKQISADARKQKEITPCILSDSHWLKLDIDNNRNSRKPTDSWKLNNSLLSDHWVKEEKEIKDFREFNENEYIICPNLRYIMKAVLRGRLRAWHVYIEKLVRPHTGDLIAHPKAPERREHMDPRGADKSENQTQGWNQQNWNKEYKTTNKNPELVFLEKLKG